jgi:hypothetical protein
LAAVAVVVAWVEVVVQAASEPELFLSATTQTYITI